jgi:glycosyltransferase involved in cell wall biosynthesis
MLLKKATEFFSSGNYDDAYELYQIAAERYGRKNFEYNLSACERKLGKEKGLSVDVKLSGKKEATSLVNKYFDNVYLVNLQHKKENRLRTATHLAKNNIHFELFEATNGYVGEALKFYQNYANTPLGRMTRYESFNEKEVNRGKKYIESAGAVGYIFTYLRILKNAKDKGYKRFLILEDDALLTRNFETKFLEFMKSVGDDWKVLQLGASQYGWESVNETEANRNGYYFPRRLDTCGSFAIAFDSSVIDELIEAEKAFEAPFDHLPMWEIYERYLGKCYVAFPNLVMPDVADSSIRGGRCQYTHGAKMKWPLNQFEYPLPKTRVSVVLKNKENLRYLTGFAKHPNQPFDLRLFYASADGFRPLHNKEFFEKLNISAAQIELPLRLPESDHYLTLDAQQVLTENDIIAYIDFFVGITGSNASVLKPLACEPLIVVPGRVSVIIPTYKRAKNLKNALISASRQDYHDIEIIVVSDNEQDSKYNEETREIVKSVLAQSPKKNVKLIEHSMNRNGAAARNTGLLHSTGEFICFLDDDDIYLEGRISKSVEQLTGSPKNVGAVYCGFLGWNSPENDLNRYKEGNLTLELLLLDYKKHYLHTNTATYKREAVLSLNGFDESYRRHQDLEFNLRFFEMYEVRAVKDCLVRLNPEPSGVDNKMFNMDLLNLKTKFLSQFDSVITSFGVETARQIYLKHWAEVARYVKDPTSIKEGIGELYKNGYSQVLMKCN